MARPVAAARPTPPKESSAAPPQAAGTGRPLNVLRLAPGENVFKEGDAGEYGYVVVSGKIEVGKNTGGQFVKLTELGEGALFGEMALIDKAPRSACARALGDASVREVDQKAFMVHIVKSPEIAINMMQRLSSYVRKSNQSLEVSVFDIPAKEKKADAPMAGEAAQRPLSEKDQQTVQEYQSPMRALEKKPVPSLARITFYCITSLFAVAVLWSSFFVTDITISTRGRITTTLPKVEVQAQDSATVRAIQVTAGSKVREGDVLVELDPTLKGVDYNKLMADLGAAQMLLERLELEKVGGTAAAGEALKDPLQRDLFLTRFQEYQSKTATLQLNILKSTSAYHQAELNLEVARLDMESAEHARAKTARLVEEKIMHAVALKEAGFNVDKARVRLRKSEADLETAVQDHQVRQLDLDGYRSGRLSGLNQEVSQARQKLASLREDKIKMDRSRENSTIKAPVSGTVLELNSLFVGALVQPGRPVLTLVPSEGTLLVELDIDPKQISNILVGNKVSLKLDALPYQKYGGLEGEIDLISEDTVDKSIMGHPGTYYRARAKITADQLRDKPKHFHLMPGMQLNADIRVGHRVLITYFLYPVIRTLQTSFTEP